VDELSLACQQLDADIVVFDAELTGAQARNIEDAVGARAVDRTTLILDIFAQRARSREGKLQVELAQLNYRLPRLMGQGVGLSRLGGGIGTRGPGERKLDVDRRHIRRRINFIEKELGQLHSRRGLLRKSSGMAHAPVVAIAGYTNAGKSTLFNALCGADAFAEDKLFATLDPTARRLDLPSGGAAMLVDTVGFIRNLPHDLIEAFKATLEETAQADVILHVADASSEELDAQMETVRRILASISEKAAEKDGKAKPGGRKTDSRRDFDGGAGGQKTIVALNKIDKLKGGGCPAAAAYGEVMCEISALTGEGLDELRELIAEAVSEGDARVELLIPYGDGGALAYVRSFGSVVENEFKDDGVKVTALLKKERLKRVEGYITRPARDIIHKRVGSGGMAT
jgi:GTP-binding protein HflX